MRPRRTLGSGAVLLYCCIAVWCCCQSMIASCHCHHPTMSWVMIVCVHWSAPAPEYAWLCSTAVGVGPAVGCGVGGVGRREELDADSWQVAWTPLPLYGPHHHAPGARHDSCAPFVPASGALRSASGVKVCKQVACPHHEACPPYSRMQSNSC